MAEHILFVTGKLARASLERVLEALEPRPFEYSIRVVGLSVAALLTTDMIKRRLGDTGGADRAILPGRCRGDLTVLDEHFGIGFERGPDELKDLPDYFGQARVAYDLERSEVRIFAEIVEAPDLSLAEIHARAERYRADGADVIDIGCLPNTPFPHLQQAVSNLKDRGFAVSVDSLDPAELRSGAGAGADYLLSLTPDMFDLADESNATPIIIAEDPTDLDALCHAIETFAKRGTPFYADPILDPVHYGFTTSIGRYHALRERFPEIQMMMGIGNLSELTHTDTLGLNALLMGIVSELQIGAVLTTQVSAHCRSAVREIDRARRIMLAARESNTAPKLIDDSLLALHERHPFPYTSDEIAELARQVGDDNFRVQVSDEGIHVYNRAGLHSATDPYDLYPLLKIDDDAPHAFYLGMELARAQIAWQLGKRYNQDEELRWGCIREHVPEDKRSFSAERSTRAARRRTRSRAKR